MALYAHALEVLQITDVVASAGIYKKLPNYVNKIQGKLHILSIDEQTGKINPQQLAETLSKLKDSGNSTPCFCINQPGNPTDPEYSEQDLYRS